MVKINKHSPVQLALRLVVIALMLGMLFAVVYPLWWMIISGFKTNAELFLDPFAMPEKFSFANFILAWKAGIGKYFANSVFITAVSSVVTTALCAIAAFPLSRYQFRMRKFWFMFILCGLMLAPQVSLISSYKLLQALNLYDTNWALILPYVTFRIPFTVFLMWSHFMTLPKDIEEAACIDGCSSFKIFSRMLVPMSKPIMATSILLTARYVWNDFMFSLVFTESSSLKTIPYGLNSMKSQGDTDWTVLLAGLTLSAVPIIILFICLQKQFVRGMTAGSVKG